MDSLFPKDSPNPHLLARIRKGDATARKELEALFSETVGSYFHSMGIKGGDVQGLVDSTFREFYKQIDNLSDTVSLNGSLLTMARWEIYKHPDYGSVKVGGRRRPSRKGEKHAKPANQNDADRLSFQVCIDPGNAKRGDIQDLFQAMSDMNRSLGGNGLEFVSENDHVQTLKAEAV